MAWVDGQKTTGGRVQHLVIVVDEMGTFIGDSNDKIGELNALASISTVLGSANIERRSDDADQYKRYRLGAQMHASLLFSGYF